MRCGLRAKHAGYLVAVKVEAAEEAAPAEGDLAEDEETVPTEGESVETEAAAKKAACKKRRMKVSCKSFLLNELII